VRTDEPPQNTGTRLVLELAKKWLRQCVHDHWKYCQEPVYWKPTRLIDLGIQGLRNYPRLIVSDCTTRTSSYMTLSHRWGIGKTFVLTTGNIEQLKRCIETSLLPQTFQDALHVVKFMGIRYLWIDSLCILQDSQEDWFRESAAMGQIFQNSYCNLLAMTGEDGLFCDRDPSLLKSHPVFWDKTSPNGSNKFYLTIQPAREKPMLEKRGWVLQEQLLSPRSLLFHRDQISWECCEMEASEVYPGGFPFLYGASSAKSIRFELRNLPIGVLKRQLSNGKIRTFLGLFNLGFEYGRHLHYLDLPLPKEPPKRHKKEAVILSTLENMIPPDPAWYYWANIVEKFTLRELTKNDDRLTAIAGIAFVLAKKLPAELPAQYLCGLWNRGIQDFFLLELLWKAESRQPLPSKYRAPSWSWASVDGPVTYFMETRDLRRITVIKDIKFIKRKAMTGEAEKIFILFSGPLLHASAQSLNEISTIFYDTTEIFPGKDMTLLPLAVGFVAERSVTEEPSFVVEPYLKAFGLVLRKQDDRTFLRVGMFRSRNLARLLNQPKEFANVT
jgi:hypothetical protein